MVILDYWLGQCYHACVVKGNGAETLKIFKQRLEADQKLKKEAQQKLTAVESINRTGVKCFISQKHAEFLRSVLI